VAGGLARRWDRRGPEFRIRHRDARGALLRQGKIARERGPLGGRNRQAARSRGSLPVSRIATNGVPVSGRHGGERPGARRKASILRRVELLLFPLIGAW